MFVGMMMAAALGPSQMSVDRQLDNALGELAYTVGACNRVLPEQAADPMVLALTGANIDNPSADQQRNRDIFSGLFKEGVRSVSAGSLSARECAQMIGDLTVALRHAAAKQADL